jgi:hypothetical protein
MTPFAIGALLAAAAMVWVIAPIFSEGTDDLDRGRPPSRAADDAAEAAIRRWREQKNNE